MGWWVAQHSDGRRQHMCWPAPNYATHRPALLTHLLSIEKWLVRLSHAPLLLHLADWLSGDPPEFPPRLVE